MNIRYYAFWALDTLKGGKVKKELARVKADMESNHPNQQQLENILSYAINNIPFYNSVSAPSIDKFPVMNKKMYLENYEQFFSPEFSKDELYTYATSGSSGTPFHGVQDQGKRRKHTADLIYFHNKCGWNLGDKYIFLRAWVSLYKNSTLSNFKNNVIPFDVLKLDQKMLEKIAELVKRGNIKMILGYGSALNQLAEYVENNNIYCKGLNTIISDSDILQPEKRELLKQHFGCKVVDRYSNEEHGLIAFSYDSSEPFEVNYSSYYVEILKLDSDEHAEKGELGRVVITDLYNKAMPLIRYELGDLAISDDESRCGVVTLHGLQGRLSDMLIMRSGIRISSATINNYMESMTGVEKYQLVQKAIGEFQLLVVEHNKEYSDKDYFDQLISCIGADSNLEVIRTNFIPNEKTGKFSTFKNLMK